MEIRSYIEHIGNSSLVCYQEVWQNECLVAKGKAVMVHFNHQTKKTIPIPDSIRAQLNEHRVPAE